MVGMACIIISTRILTHEWTEHTLNSQMYKIIITSYVVQYTFEYNEGTTAATFCAIWIVFYRLSHILVLIHVSKVNTEILKYQGFLFFHLHQLPLESLSLVYVPSIFVIQIRHSLSSLHPHRVINIGWVPHCPFHCEIKWCITLSLSL